MSASVLDLVEPVVGPDTGLWASHFVSNPPQTIKPESIDESRAVYFALKPNRCSLHEERLIHGADASTSDRRAGYTSEN